MNLLKTLGKNKNICPRYLFPSDKKSNSSLTIIIPTIIRLVIGFYLGVERRCEGIP